jgi:Mce-associated membrane protein
VLLPAVTGWSVGRAVTGLTVQRPDGTLAGPVRLLLRDLAHLLDSLSVFVGWLWPVADERGRTFADLLAGTEVHRMAAERRPRNASSLTVGVFGTAALLCVVVAALGQLLVYQRDRGIDTARTQIAAQGPKIVEQMLSYQPESLPDDFARAQSLATDGYREQLAEQQQHVLEQGGKPVPNAYRVVNSSVLSDPAPTPNRVAMLLFMQGQRGDQGKERFISATVRVTFAKVGAQWRVDSLTPVTKAVAVEDGK